ncbi:hypothetical protein EYC80_007077 [Monilinia laxa]|uniref:Secreted protein n=1 Tax=Monilinia laxa TaxID=61186 RepID=A0A5N6K055_MONLA|nr:hypothetical protein EYC80_007077 [Monilinia laxa]
MALIAQWLIGAASRLFLPLAEVYIHTYMHTVQDVAFSPTFPRYRIKLSSQINVHHSSISWPVIRPCYRTHFIIASSGYLASSLYS